MTAQEFYNKYINKGIDVDKSAGIQCVDLFKVFTKEMWGIYNYNCGNGYANGLWLNRKSRPYYSKFVEVSLNNLQNGDWVFWDKGSKDCPLSHVAMYYNGKFFGQNQNGKSYATLVSINMNGALGALRPKEYVKIQTSNNTNYVIKYTTSNLNERTGAGVNYPSVNVLLNKSAVKVYETVNGWSRIETEMWCSDKYLSTTKPARHIMTMEVTNCSLLNVRSGAGTNYKILKTIPVNTVVSVLEEKNNWIRIYNNQWVCKSYLK